jgi:hypothetical protein
MKDASIQIGGNEISTQTEDLLVPKKQTKEPVELPESID